MAADNSLTNISENRIKFLIILNNLNANYYEQNFTLSITFTACFSK